MNDFFSDKKYIVVTGNYGSGKTEISLNTAFGYSEEYSTTLVDLDIVNPYFRSGEKAEELKAAGIRVLMPTFALTTVDIPALPPEIQSVFEVPCDKVVFDVGGDDTGAAALGRYAPSFAAFRQNTIMVMVVNCMRPLTETAEDIVDLARRIENRSRMKIDMLINNTNLADRTEPEMLLKGESIVREAANLLNIPTVINAGTEEILKATGLTGIPVSRMTVPEWMEEL